MNHLPLFKLPAGYSVKQSTGWLLHHMIMKAMEMREAAYVPAGNVQPVKVENIVVVKLVEDLKKKFQSLPLFPLPHRSIPCEPSFRL